MGIMKFYRSGNVYFYSFTNVLRPLVRLKKLLGDHIYHLAKYELVTE